MDHLHADYRRRKSADAVHRFKTNVPVGLFHPAACGSLIVAG
jgi:hypothetical protein